MRTRFAVSAALILLAASATSFAEVSPVRDTSSSAQDCSANPASCTQDQSSDSADQPRDTSTDWSGISAGEASRGSRNLSSTNQLQNGSSADAANLTSTAQTPRQPQQFPPAPPSEFQKFVAATTGQRLNIYGADLFRNVPASFEPSNLEPASADYVIGPDDELRVRIWGGINYTGNLRVDRSGNIFLPQVGSVHVAGLKFAELDEHLRAATGRIFRSFDLSADLGRIRSIQVYVTGQARRPGVYTISSLSSLVDALFASGGPSPQGSLRHIQLKREGKTVVDFDLYALLLHGDKSGDVRLQAEDVLFIPPAGPQVAAMGSIRVPAIYEMRDHETIGDLIDMASKTTSLTAQTRVSLDRAEQNQRTAVEFALDATGLAAPLADGDIVRVFSIVPSYRKTVTLRGSVANAGRYGWNENMHLSDLLPDRDALMSRDYWWRRNHLGLASPDFEPQVANADPLLNTLHDEISGNPNPQSGNPNPQGRNLPSADQSASHASIAVQSQAASETDPATGQPIVKKNTVRIVAPELDWDYAVIERVDPASLKTSLIPFDLGKLVLQHDSSQDLALEAGDTVTIFSQNDIHVPIEQQTKYITLEGEVVHAGTYSVQPNETLRDVLRRAGGLTSKAYLYASEFDRESTRILQQQRIDEYVRALQLDTSRSTIAFANYASLSGQGGGQATNTTVQTEFLEQLKKIRATGRVVLKIPPTSNAIDDLPAMALENGDRFIVPSIPATVNIVGAVYDQNTFLYRSGETVNKYLQLAGGPDRSADAKRAYIIRADGSVLNRDSSSDLWHDSFKHAKLFPGDTIIVPDKNFAPNLSLKNFLEWTQMFSQLAMGAATISLLK
jgi:protein involved in polysaccharide export with SLBB domain